jgi:hypothetical protein
MAVYDCQCGLVLSTTREHPVCPRCHRIVEAGQPDGQARTEEAGSAVASAELEQLAAGVERKAADSTPAPLGVREPMLRVAVLRPQPPSVDFCLG